MPTLFLASYSGPPKPSSVKARLLQVPLFQKHPFTDFRVLKELGRGSFSVVRKAQNVHAPPSSGGAIFPPIVALKEYDPKRTKASVLAGVHFEMNVLSQLSHPAVVGLYGVYSVPEKLCLVLEYLRGGELLKEVCRKKTYAESDARHLVRQLAQALAYTHSRDVIHRDVKPENLIFQDHSTDSPIKLVDFGLCLVASDMPPEANKVVCGTKGYLAPEVVTEGRYGFAVDCWAMGVVVYILLSGECLPLCPCLCYTELC